MKTKTHHLPGIMTLTIIILLVVSSLFLGNSCKNNSSGSGEDSTYHFKHIPADTTKLIIWKKPGATDAEVKDWLDALALKYGKIENTIVCQDCDNDLMLLSGPGPTNFVSGQTAIGGSGGKGGPSGGDGPVYYSINFPVNFIVDTPKEAKSFTVKMLQKTPTKKEIVVAVFDTGVEPASIGNYFYQIPEIPCLGADAGGGWNYAYNNSRWYQDDYPTMHGTTVTKFIINQVNSFGQNGVKILPIKIHDKNGKSDLFKVLCGFAYASKSGAKIINASFGYYSPKYYFTETGLRYRDSSATLLKAYVKHYLTDSGILLIAAAGNKDDYNELAVYNPANRAYLRDLDSVCFYPASLAEDVDCKNVIAVTTANTSGMISPYQNFSNNVVDVCVYSDQANEFNFQNPLHPNQSVNGSSFAAPIVTGNICANYYLIENLITSNNYSKTQLFDTLKNNNISGINPALEPKIAQGRVMSRYKIGTNGLPQP